MSHPADQSGSSPPLLSAGVWRVVDANLNRTAEGLRVVEDYLRFIVEDRHLTEVCKQLRHEFGLLTRQLSSEHRLPARDTQGDVGTELQTAQEYQRTDAVHVAEASLARASQALRSLEEYGKLIDQHWALSCEQLRYRLYTVEKAMAAARRALQRLSDCRLYVLVDAAETEGDFRRRLEQVVEAGADVIQLRDKQLGDRQLLKRAEWARQLTAARGLLFIMNDRPDLARLSQADGVHVGQEELTPQQVRTICGPEILVGVSTHSLSQAKQAVLDGADYLGVGPVFPSSTKSFGQWTGPALLQEVASEISLPAFAIGGISHERLPKILAAGFSRIAVGHAIWRVSDPASAVHTFHRLLDHHPKPTQVHP